MLLNKHSVLFFCALFLIQNSAAQNSRINIENSCATCSRKENDSINVYHRRAIRINQAGYLPNERKKSAFVASSSGGEFSIIDSDANSVYTGTLQFSGTYIRPQMTAKGHLDYLTLDYEFKSDSGSTEDIYIADFSSLEDNGRYRVVHDKDTSAPFLVHPNIYDKVLEKVLFSFGANRCGDTDSWLHGPCHLKDGSHLGETYTGRLAGGWHDCGDHGKYSETTAYTTLVLSLACSI